MLVTQNWIDESSETAVRKWKESKPKEFAMAFDIATDGDAGLMDECFYESCLANRVAQSMRDNMGFVDNWMYDTVAFDRVFPEFKFGGCLITPKIEDGRLSIEVEKDDLPF